jgi:hypothetical protein
MKIKEILLFIFMCSGSSILAMQNTTGDNSPIPASDEEEIPFYFAEWPDHSQEDDVLEAFMVYISGLDPISKERALKKLRVFMIGLEASVKSMYEAIETEFNLPLGVLFDTPPQSLRFDN